MYVIQPFSTNGRDSFSALAYDMHLNFSYLNL